MKLLILLESWWQGLPIYGRIAGRWFCVEK